MFTSTLRLVVLSFILLAFFAEGRGQDKAIDKVISPLKYAEINNNHEARYSAVKTLILVEFANQAEATSKKDDLKITSNLEDLAVRQGQVDATVDKKFLVFDLKEKLQGTDNITFAFIEKGKKLGVIKLVKEKTSVNGDRTVNELKYRPKAPPSGFDILANLPNSPSAIDKKTYEELSSGKANYLIYSFCGNDDNNKLFYKKNCKGKFRPLVGTPLSILLNPVPNPLRYDITITSKYNNYGMDTDPLLEDLLLNPSKFLPGAQAGGKDDEKLTEEEKTRKEYVLGYLYKINAQITEFMDRYNNEDCIDAQNFSAQKRKIEGNIKAQLINDSKLNYLGNYMDFIQIEFNDYDSNYVKPLAQNYLRFKNLNISPFYYQIPRLKNADELSINLKILPKTKSNAAMKVDSMDIDLPIFGGFKIDVSPGLFYSFYNSNLYTLRNDSTVVKGSTGSDSVTSHFRTIVKESENKNDIGFSSLLHFYSRWGRDINIAASIGAGITLNDKPEVRYFTGLSVLIGRVNRLALSVGRSFGKVEEISDRYFERDDRKDNYRKVNMQETALQTNKVLKSGWFASISHNIPLINRKVKPEGSKPSANEQLPTKKPDQEETKPQNDSKNGKQEEKKAS